MLSEMMPTDPFAANPAANAAKAPGRMMAASVL
jgi:hypothetical protein